MRDLKQRDPAIHSVVKNELARQQKGLELIASENYVSRAVMQTMGSVLTNKYSEGYPGKRYYGGNEHVDVSEQLAIDRAKKLFGAEHANVQPHAGSQANMEAYFSLLNLGDKILGMDLAHGGHLTHGSQVNFSGKFYKFVNYGVDKETMRLDMDEIRKIAIREKPRLILSGFSAYPRKLDFREFQEIAHEVGAYHMADMAHIAGPCAVGLHQNPVPFCDVVTTTTHKTLRGPRGALILSKIEDRLRPDDKKNLARKIDSAVFPGMQGGPLDHVIAAKAVAFGEALQPEFESYQSQVLKNAKVLADTLMNNGLKLVSDGTDNHLMLVDLTKTGHGGKKVEKALDEVFIFTNKNMIPFDERSPFNPSGIRLGTPALTTRGMKDDEMRKIGIWLSRVIQKPDDTYLKMKVKAEVLELCREFPIYEGLGE
ncbi:serine hydroxymethyltransferase [Candidatus Woesearchaeota archaeon]|nr:serine hydroxymethyltransferase [Candidatus Woesearchaeota archaeon]